MRLYFWTVLFSLLITLAYGWTNEDHEIFDLVSAIEAAEGKGTSFYSWLEISPSASSAEVSRAYRKKSMQLHPDKNPGVKNAHERFARLGVIAQILRSQEGRERYDFFYKNGVPKWRGTGYYYSRYRPGLVSVFIFLTILTSGLQYIVQRMNYKSDLARIERFVREARIAAWGTKLLPLEGKRKVRVNIGGKPYMDEEGNYVPGKQIDMVVEGDGVYIVDGDGTLLPLDAGAASSPSIRRTWFISLVSSIYVKVTRGSKVEDRPSGQVGDADETDGSLSDSPRSGASTPNGGVVTGRAAAAKAGGRRRKALRKKA